MAASRSRSKPTRSSRDAATKPDVDPRDYERGHGAPFSPVSDENRGSGSPAVKEMRRRADGSMSNGKDQATGKTGTVNAPKAPEATSGKTAAKRKAASSVAPAGHRAPRSRNPHPAR